MAKPYSIFVPLASFKYLLTERTNAITKDS
jgi:hypothetical protein